MRYTDEGETIELCRWTVDLGTLPSFQQHANNPQPGGFYTGKLLADSIGATNNLTVTVYRL